MDDLSFFDYLSPFCFLLIEFHCNFPTRSSPLILLNTTIFCLLLLYFDQDVIGRQDVFFVPALRISILMPLFVPSSSVSLSFFALAVPMRECLGKHSCMSSPCLIAILNGTFLFREAK